jgi:hypothetical protein
MVSRSCSQSYDERSRFPAVLGPGLWLRTDAVTE